MFIRLVRPPLVCRFAPAAAAACLLAAPTFAQDFVISGKITTTDGVAAAGAHVRIIELARHTDAGPDGTYRFDALPRGSFLLEVRSDRFGARVARAEAPASGNSVVVDIVLSAVAHEESIVVTSGLEASTLAETAKPITVLAGLDLAAKMKPTLGDTLADQPGVSATSFGPGASRPVVRGLGGDRVRILQDGVGTSDASNTSPDHAVSFDPLSAEQIEVVRGPATLLYGSTAIGGVVNVIDGRIPESRAERRAGGLVDLAMGTIAREKQGGASLHGGQGGFAWHADGLRRKTGDVRVPEEGAIANTAVENTSGSLGVSLVGAQGFLGANAALFDTTYGIPSEEDVAIDMKQRRLDIKAAYREPFGLFRGVKFRLGLASYEHSEIEGAEVGTRFDNQGYEGRIEFLHQDAGPFRGAFGFQAQGRDLTVAGEEAFLPPSRTGALAAFVLEEIGTGRARLSLGGRVETQRVEVVDGPIRAMTGVSGSAGLIWKARGDLSMGLTLSHSERLPGAEELFSNGPHAATAAFEVGDPSLSKEKSLGLDASIRKSGGPVTLSASFFRNAFRGYIFERFTDEEQDGLRLVQYEQRDARFWGFEAEARWILFESATRHLSLEASADYVRASLDKTGEALPRIAPMRLGGGLHYRDSRFDLRAETRRTRRQDRVAAFETPTEGYNAIDATASYRIFGGSRTVTDLILRGTNLGDALGRNHVSYIKDLVPVPGRDFRAAVRFQF